MSKSKSNLMKYFRLFILIGFNIALSFLIRYIALFFAWVGGFYDRGENNEHYLRAIVSIIMIMYIPFVIHMGVLYYLYKKKTKNAYKYAIFIILFLEILSFLYHVLRFGI